MLLRKHRAEPHAEQHRHDERDGDDRGDEGRAHGHTCADTYTLCMPKSSPRPRTSTSVRGTADRTEIMTQEATALRIGWRKPARLALALRDGAADADESEQTALRRSPRPLVTALSA